MWRSCGGFNRKTLLLNLGFQVKEAYINFLNHCYIDTEVEMKEMYNSQHMWTLFEHSVLVDLGLAACGGADRQRADPALDTYVTGALMTVVSME